MSEIALLSNKELLEFGNTSISSDGNLFECITPGCLTLDLSSRGCTTFCATSLYLAWGQSMGLTNPGFFIHKIRDATHEVYQIYREHFITLEFYKGKNRVTPYYPMKISSRVQSLGKSTITMETIMRNAVNNVPVACCYSTLVHIDFETRRSAPIPDHIRKRFAYLSNQRPRPTQSFLNISPPAEAFEHSFVTRFSDTDILQHVNHSQYVTYCLDAASVAASRNKLKGFSADMAPWLVKKNRCSYAAECLAGETLKVTLWQDELLPELIHFRISKLDGQLSYASSMEFYLNEDADIGLEDLIADENVDLSSPTFTNSSFILSDVDMARWKHFSFNKDRTRAEGILPRPLILSFNPKGQISLACFPDYFELAHTVVMGQPGFCIHTTAIVPEGCGIFFVQMDYIFERDLFKSSTDFQGLYRPLRSVVKFHSFTRSSICLEIKLYDIESRACIATAYIKQLVVDFTTRRAIQIPASLRQRFSQICANQVGLKPIPDLPPPGECFTHYDTVRYSDIDENHHLNGAVYVKLCFDAAVTASEKGSLVKFSGDAYIREMTAVRCSYIKQCEVGEVLQIKVWQDQECMDKLNCRVVKNDGSLSMLCSMEFYSTENHSKL